MAIHWQVTFVTLRGGKTLTASVYDNTYSGDPIPLKGGGEPFSTEEDDDDDPFAAIRIQTGSLKIVDDGYDANGGSFNWRDLQPRSDYDRPVILTDEDDNILWQGFLQAQNFSGTLYEKVQEREFPLQCPLSILSSQYPNITDQGIVNFAFLLEYITSMISAASVATIAFTEIVIQGGADAQKWLLKKFHWANLLSEDDDENLAPQYDLYTCLQDMCNFWGWQARTSGTRLYLMCQDDEMEQTILTLTPEELLTMASGTAAGTVSSDAFIRQDLAGNIFASADNDDMWITGPSEVTVGADCNEQSSAAEFAPPTVRKQMEDAGNYSWVAGSEELTGYFTTPMINSFTSNILDGSVSGSLWAGFCRRQIYSSKEQANPTKIDAFVFASDVEPVVPIISIQTKRMMSLSDGTLKLSGSVWNGNGWQQWNSENDDDYIKVRIGIGLTKQTAKWFYLESTYGSTVISHGWSSTVKDCRLTVGNGDIKGVSLLAWAPIGFPITIPVNFDGIPTDPGMYGYIFVDFLGIYYDAYNGAGTPGGRYVVGDFKIEFSREKTYIPANTQDATRPREMKKDRISSMDYTAINGNAVKNEWNADLIYASDNNMKYGYGLVMNPNYEYMAYAYYGESIQHPEQHFADRIANFWNASRRVITADLQTNAVENAAPITPRQHLVLGALHYRTLAISHQWRDDVTTVKMIQSLITIEDEEE